MKATFLFLGTGASTGIPVIGCHCAVCESPSAYNRRLRPSGLIRASNQTILIDCGPDFRQQALRYRIEHLDALLLTHTHYDHIAGLDDLRGFFFRDRRALKCFLSEKSFEELKRHYDYLFEPDDGVSITKPQLEFELLKGDAGSLAIDGMKIDYFCFMQCKMPVNGFRMGELAYVTDIRSYDEKLFQSLNGVKKLVISAISKASTRAHFSVQEAIHFAGRIKAEQAWLTHIGHEIDHEKTVLPSGVKIGYDGLEFEFEI
jgi:phosphoribosyl 1,2-cyclic phosphate phosphodiesterase